MKFVFYKVAAIALWLLLTDIYSLQAQKITISGHVEDAETGEKLIGATISDVKSRQATAANQYGFFSFTLPQDSIHVAFSYIGYEPKFYHLSLKKDLLLTVKLKPDIALDALIVSANDKTERIEQTARMSTIDIPIQLIKKSPALFGESDVLKTIQLLPGVQSGGEGQAGLYVRGGSPDQNLVLLDGVPVYNVSHILGIFSVFNADAIHNVSLVKGGFPARYGGRLASVLDISMKEGNAQTFHGEGGIGVISSRITLEGPILKEKMSFMVSARRTYAEPLLKLLSNTFLDSANTTNKVYFYDLNAKINCKINDKHHLYLSAYTGKDVAKVNNALTLDNGHKYGFNSDIQWGNLTAAVRWNYMLHKKMFSNTAITYTKYNFDAYNDINVKLNSNPTNTFSSNLFSGINDIGLKYDIDYVPNPNHFIRVGTSVTQHTYSPQQQTDTLQNPAIQSVEATVYVEDELRLGNFRANVGLHYSAFKVENSFYNYLQPRVSLNYLLPAYDIAVKTSFTTMAQYINLLSNESFTMPNDFWVPSTTLIKPQYATQAAVGLAKTFLNEYEVSAEAYYKKMDNVLSYKEGTSFINTETGGWESKIAQGQGLAYGGELFLQKKKGNTSGWVSYTLAWNNRQFDEINGGRWFPYKYDRRHDFKIIVSQKISNRIHLTTDWIYSTGNAITLPTEIYLDPNRTPVLNTSTKNSFRMAPYHRLDVSIEHLTHTKWGESKWVLSIFNAYNRKNPYTLFITKNDDKQFVLRQFSLLTIIPSISWGFKF